MTTAVSTGRTPADERRRAGSTFLICTLNRPEDLQGALHTLLTQSVLPQEVVIVDASEESSEALLRAMTSKAGVGLQYLRTTPGRTRQLNLGVKAARGDPVFIIDDDVRLDPEFHAAMLDTFEAGGADVGGVQGTVINDTFRSLPARAFRALFLLSRHTQNDDGRLLPSGYYTTPVRPTEVREVKALRLCGLAFRRRVFDEFTFDERLEGYALKEDIDFSYRVSRRYRLLVSPEARFRHLKAPSSRISVRSKSKMHVVNNYRFFRKNLERTIPQKAAFIWAMLGRLLYEAARSTVKREPAYFLGYLDGVVEVLRRRRRDRGRRRREAG
ncbi:MAG TPA: glycosyltransferase [Actinomycetota bacterium]|nr:glycosyltransferase [Actinomycetota bacterium]